MRIKLMLAFAIIAMAGCFESNPPQNQPTIAEELLRREREQRAEIEISKDRETASKETWQGLAAFAAIGAGLLLIAGIILGSTTKHDAERDK